MILVFCRSKTIFKEEAVNKFLKKIIENIIPKNKKIISIFPGSRKSETDLLLNILIDFIKLMNKKQFQEQNFHGVVLKFL